MAIMRGYGYDKVNDKVKRLDYDNDNPQPKGIKVITITGKEQTPKQPQYIKIKPRTENYGRCESRINEVRYSIKKWLAGIENLVQIAGAIPSIDRDDFAAMQKRSFADIMDASMVMTDALIEKYNITEQEDIEDMRNLVLGLKDDAEAVLK